VVTLYLTQIGKVCHPMPKIDILYTELHVVSGVYANSFTSSATLCLPFTNMANPS